MIRIKKLGAIRPLVFVGLLAIGLIATSPVPALAGSGGFSSTGSMNVARDGHTATLLPNGEVLEAGGENNTAGNLASAELYNPAKGKWTLTGSMTTPRYGHDAVLLQSGEVLVAGGINASTSNCANLASAELYNPSTGIWTATGSMSAGRYDFALTLLPNGEVLAAGGTNCGGGGLTSAELYNPATGTWTATGSMASGAENNGSVLLQDGDVFVDADNLYHPSTGTWTAASSPTVGGGLPIVLLSNGDVWTAGNLQGDSLYNPTTNQWTAFAPPPCTTNSQNCESAAALLSTGQVLVAGGATYVNAQPYPTEETNGLAELFDPSTLTWASTGSMNKSRLQETMTVLPNGQVLAAGGETYDKSVGHLVAIASAELYTP